MANTNVQTSSMNDVSKVQGISSDPGNYSIDQLLCLIRLERMNGLNKQYKTSLNKLRMGQLKISTLTEVRRFITLSKDKDGKFDASNPEFQDLIVKSKEKYESLREELIAAGETTDSIEIFGDFLEEIGIQEGKKSYSKDETQSLLDAIRMTTDQLSPLNEMHMQAVTRIEGEINETYTLLINVYKTLHALLVGMAKSIRP